MTTQTQMHACLLTRRLRGQGLLQRRLWLVTRAVCCAVFLGLLSMGLCASPSPAGTHYPASSLVGVVNLDGKPVDPWAAPGIQATVLVFLRNDCPISNRYVPEIRRLREHFRALGVRFWLVHPTASESVAAIRQHGQDFQLSGDELLDPKHELVKRAGARVTPEVAVFDRHGQRVYHGRIDDRVVELGRERPVATRHDLEEVLTALLADRPVRDRNTPAVGCGIPHLP